ncbi:MAG: class I tRNA ligase family protein, partial [Candidatus Margulisiibacteriota bacterium]
AKINGADLAGTVTKHPFIDRTSSVFLADYVTKEDGTGFVHIAPGHGQEDYQVGLKYNLPIIMPIDNEGKFTKEVPELQGINIFDANKIICQKMTDLNVLLKLEFTKHSYPHCWRCKKPVIFRAVEQWFIAVDKPFNGPLTLREKALKTLKEVKWYPGWGENRITGMINNRPDWCISRQRFWGIPLPIFICKNCGQAEMKGEFNKAAKEIVAKEGSIAWFVKSAEEILPKHLECSQCNSSEFIKDQNILDVWFESGSSFNAVLENPPAQLYLEGSDQHRGWFQSSLLIGLASIGKAPFEAVLTHGFLTDDRGKKMSKSEGNVVSPNEVIKTMGADVLRFWAASAEFKNSDISITQNIVKQAQDNFAKIRNTLRFLLSNTHDFDPTKNLIAYLDLNEIDQWILHKLFELNSFVVEAYNEFDFHLITHKIHDFAAVTLSSLYLDMVKDRLYCDKSDSKNRRSSQTAIYYLLDTLIKLIAPILVFTAEEAYSYFNKPGKAASIHLENFSNLPKEFNNQNLATKWDQLLKIKDLVYAKLEALRNEKTIKSFLEAKVNLTLAQDLEFSDWPSLLIVSKVNIDKGTELSIEVKKSEKEKCDRCWKYLDLTNNLCERCLPLV